MAIFRGAGGSGDATTDATNEATAAAASAAAASVSESAAATSASNAAASYDSFDDRYLGAKASNPSVDNDGNALITGAIYWNTTSNSLLVWDGSAWDPAAFTVSGSVSSFNTRTGAVTLSSSDVTTALGFTPGAGTVTSVSGTAPVSVATGTTTPVISMAAATGSVNGYLTSTDWTTFNNKGSGTVTSASVVSANGFAGTVATATTTPAITLTTSITGVLKGNGTAISAATAGTDYAAIATASTWSASQRGTVTTDNDGSFDMSVTNNFKCTPTATFALTFTNITAGQSGYVLLVNTGGYAVTAAATTKVNTSFLTTTSTAGTYLLSYFTDGTNVYVTTGGAMA
jgi:hypothetical protein